MAFTGLLYGLAFTQLWNAEIDYDTHAIHAAMTTDAETPDQDADNFWDDAVANEVANGSGYVTNGAALASKTVTYTGGTNKHVLDAADPSWATFSATFRNVHFVDRNAASDATRPMIGYQRNDANITGGGGTLTLVLASAGLVEITVA